MCRKACYEKRREARATRIATLTSLHTLCAVLFLELDIGLRIKSFVVVMPLRSPSVARCRDMGCISGCYIASRFRAVVCI